MSPLAGILIFILAVFFASWSFAWMVWEAKRTERQIRRRLYKYTGKG